MGISILAHTKAFSPASCGITNFPVGMWKHFWQRFRAQDDWADSAPAGEDPELREIFVRSGLRVAAAFAVIFGLVYFAFWWSGSAVGFGANRAAGQSQPTWKVLGFVRSATTREAVPWAVIEDDPSGRPPFFHADATYSGSYELVTL